MFWNNLFRISMRRRSSFPQSRRLIFPKSVAHFPKVGGWFSQSRWLISPKSVPDFQKAWLFFTKSGPIFFLEIHYPNLIRFKSEILRQKKGWRCKSNDRGNTRDVEDGARSDAYDPKAKNNPATHQSTLWRKNREKPEKNLRKSGEHTTGRLEGKDREHCICGYIPEKTHPNTKHDETRTE